MFHRTAVFCVSAVSMTLGTVGCHQRNERSGGAEPSVTCTTFALRSEADCPAGANIIKGTDGPDQITGTSGNDCILGLGGDDVIDGGGGDDTIFGGPGNDSLSGGNGKDTIWGEEGNDVIQGDNATDALLSGGPGNDIIIAGNGNAGKTVVEGGEGMDFCSQAAPGCEQIALPCNKSGQCPTGQHCEPSALICVSCLVDQDCYDGNACTVDSCMGYTTCQHAPVSTCGSGDGCCPAGCNANLDTDCSPLCGNGVVEVGETCDPRSSCATSCNDGNACTVDQMTGSAANCNVVCGHAAIATCASGDGCCPAGCDANIDNDCSPSCGNQVVELGETCDPSDSCPTSCQDGNACTVDETTGSAANCNVACTHTAITSCASGDGCCPAGCDANLDDDCSPLCGNQVVEPGETCDPNGSCPTSCNDGNACTIDQMTGSALNCNVACSHTSMTTCSPGDGCCPAGCNANLDDDCSPLCGNEVVESGETCDPGSSCPANCSDGDACTIDQLTGSAVNCNVACGHTSITICASGDGCCPVGCNASLDADCPSLCGNGVVEPGETCDPPSSCPSSCDDGNACTIDLPTGNPAVCNAGCGHVAISSCGAGDGCCPAGCNANNDVDCSPICGNEVVEPGETCDPSSLCPTSCDDGDPRTQDIMSGSPAVCRVTCSHQPSLCACTPATGCLASVSGGRTYTGIPSSEVGTPESTADDNDSTYYGGGAAGGSTRSGSVTLRTLYTFASPLDMQSINFVASVSAGGEGGMYGGAGGALWMVVKVNYLGGSIQTVFDYSEQRQTQVGGITVSKDLNTNIQGPWYGVQSVSAEVGGGGGGYGGGGCVAKFFEMRIVGSCR